MTLVLYGRDRPAQMALGVDAEGDSLPSPSSLLRWAASQLKENFLREEDLLNGWVCLFFGLLFASSRMQFKVSADSKVWRLGCDLCRLVFCRLADRLLSRRCSFPFHALMTCQAELCASCPALGEDRDSSSLPKPLRGEFYIVHNYQQLQVNCNVNWTGRSSQHAVYRTLRKSRDDFPRAGLSQAGRANRI